MYTQEETAAFHTQTIKARFSNCAKFKANKFVKMFEKSSSSSFVMELYPSMYFVDRHRRHSSCKWCQVLLCILSIELVIDSRWLKEVLTAIQQTIQFADGVYQWNLPKIRGRGQKE